MQMMDELPQYHLMDPHDFRVGHRYRDVEPGREHEFTVDRVELIDDQIVVRTFGGLKRIYRAHQIAAVVCDQLED
jgi:hypothetical protein